MSIKRLNGVHLKHFKNTESETTVSFPLSAKVILPMGQGMGAPCEPLVNVGDKVFVGQKIGDSDKFMSVPVHSSVSGTVKELRDYALPGGRYCKAVVIESDGKQTVDETIAPPEIKTADDFIKAVRESGAVGLGGAGFPTHVKLRFENHVDTLIINAAECEPYITSDYREMMENPSDVYDGIKLMLEKLNINRAKLCIEKNKPKAIRLFSKMAAKDNALDVVTLPSKYPQGAEKMLLFTATGRVVKENELIAAENAIVVNVSTVAFINRYIKTGMPLISRRLTVDGDAVGMPCNIEVLLGTTIKDILDYSNAKDYRKLIMGGPMMGVCMVDPEAPVIKTHNALLALKSDTLYKSTPCIRCGKCIKACPMNLMPTELEKAYHAKSREQLTELRVNLCMNCGACSYVCPAKRPLAETNCLSKEFLRNTAQK